MNCKIQKKIFYTLVILGILVQTYTFLQILIGADKLSFKFKPYFFPISLVYDQEIKFYSYLEVKWSNSNGEKSVTLNRINYTKDNYIFDVVTRRIFVSDEKEKAIKNFFCKILVKENDYYFENPERVEILIKRLKEEVILRKVEISCE